MSIFLLFIIFSFFFFFTFFFFFFFFFFSFFFFFIFFIFFFTFFFFFFFFFFNDTATTEIYTLSLHDALPISPRSRAPASVAGAPLPTRGKRHRDRKSTRLNSSHVEISYAVFCLKKKKKKKKPRHTKNKKTKTQNHK